MRVKGLLTATMVMALLAAGAPGAIGQDEVGGQADEGFRSKTVEPGVERILHDGAGHDLTKRWPERRRNVDHIAVSPDGEVWLSISAAGPDAEGLKGSRLWPLGQEGVYGPRDRVPKEHERIFFDPSGELWVIGDPVAVFDGESWSTAKPRLSALAPDGSAWLATRSFGVESWDGVQLARHLGDVLAERVFVMPDGTVGVLAWDSVWLRDGGQWTRYGQTDNQRAATPYGVLAVLGADDNGGLWLTRNGEVVSVLQGSALNGLAAAPDGSIWASGNVGKTNGGLYHIDPEAVFRAARASS